MEQCYVTLIDIKETLHISSFLAGKSRGSCIWQDSIAKLIIEYPLDLSFVESDVSSLFEVTDSPKSAVWGTPEKNPVLLMKENQQHLSSPV